MSSQYVGEGGTSSSQSDNNSQGNRKEERVWSLKDCDMKVVGLGKRDQKDDFMTLSLSFQFEENPHPKTVDMQFNTDTLKNAWHICCNALDDVVFLDNCTSRETRTGFVEFIYQEVRKFKEEQKLELSQMMEEDKGGKAKYYGKKTMQYFKPTVEEIGATIYLIAADVFILGGKPRKLTPEEVKELPIIISWKGTNYSFRSSELECVTLLCAILRDVNKMQPLRFVSFPLAVIVAHLAGQLYKLIVAKHGGFSTQMSVSGPASSTGKSLMQTVGMLLFYGEVQPTTTSITESTFYDMLEDGNIYVKEFNLKKTSRSNSIGIPFLQMAVPAIWERNQRQVKTGKGKPKVIKMNGVTHIDANVLPEDLEPHFDEAFNTKLKCIYTGSEPLSHPDENELVESIFENARKAYEFLPDLLSLGVDTLLTKVTALEMEDLAAVLKKPDDKRDGQLVAQYDRFYTAVKDRAVEFGIPLPTLFEKDVVDRTALTYFNTDDEERERMEVVATGIIEVIRANRAGYFVEHSERSSNFKVKMGGIGYPPSLVQDLKLLKSSATLFGGKKQRVVFLPESALKQELIEELHSMCCRYEQIVKAFAEEEARRLEAYAEKFYDRVAKYKIKDDYFGELRAGIENPVEVNDQIAGDTDDDDHEEDERDSKRLRGESAQNLQPEKMYKCEERKCKDYDKDFKTAAGKERHDRSKKHTNAALS